MARDNQRPYMANWINLHAKQRYIRDPFPCLCMYLVYSANTVFAYTSQYLMGVLVNSKRPLLLPRTFLGIQFRLSAWKSRSGKMIPTLMGIEDWIHILHHLDTHSSWSDFESHFLIILQVFCLLNWRAVHSCIRIVMAWLKHHVVRNMCFPIF